MKIRIAVLAFSTALLLSASISANAQSCNPAVVNYIVRDEQGAVIGGDELKALHQQLPKTIGNADTFVGEVSFASDQMTFYWPESVDFEKGAKLPALEFANAKTCTLDFPSVDLTYHGKKMRLVFNITIERSQHDRRPVVDSLPFQEGTFVLDLSSWPRDEHKMVPATFWKKSKPE